MALAESQQMKPCFMRQRPQERPHVKPVVHGLRFLELPVQQVVLEQTRRTKQDQRGRPGPLGLYRQGQVENRLEQAGDCFAIGRLLRQLLLKTANGVLDMDFNVRVGERHHRRKTSPFHCGKNLQVPGRDHFVSFRVRSSHTFVLGDAVFMPNGNLPTFIHATAPDIYR
jgi:hypothetical protein